MIGKGIHKHIEDADYRQLPYLSKSDIFSWIDGPPDCPEALLIGSLFDTALTEPDSLKDRYALAPELDLRKTDDKAKWAEFTASAEIEGKTPVRPQHTRLVAELRKSVMHNPQWRKVIEHAGATQVTLVGDEPATGLSLTMKGRVDKAIRVGGKIVLVDYKTTGTASSEDWPSSMAKYHYYAQAALYADLFESIAGERPEFLFLVVSKRRPHGSWHYRMTPHDFEIGREDYRVAATLHGRYATKPEPQAEATEQEIAA